MKVLTAVMVGATVLVACGSDGSDKPAASLVPKGAKVSRLTISADGAGAGRARYRAARTVRAGLVEVRFKNADKAPRKAQLWRVAAGHTVAQALHVGRRLPRWLTWAGGVGLTAPKGTGSTVQRLSRGHYFVTGNRDERRGVASFRVTAGAAGARPPSAETRIIAVDYGFKVSGLESGPTPVEFRNTGAEPHHAFFVPLLEGRTLEEATAYFAGKLGGPPPIDADATRETAVLEGGERQVTRLSLQSGRYALLCFVRDRAGGRPHIEKGMVAEVKVP